MKQVVLESMNCKKKTLQSNKMHDTQMILVWWFIFYASLWRICCKSWDTAAVRPVGR